MKVVTNNPSAPIAIAEPVTVARESRGAVVFNVPAGMPLGSAFDQLSVLLSSAQSALEATAMQQGVDAEPTATWSAVHNLQLAYDLVQSMHKGYMEFRSPTKPT